MKTENQLVKAYLILSIIIPIVLIILSFIYRVNILSFYQGNSSDLIALFYLSLAIIFIFYNIGMFTYVFAKRIKNMHLFAIIGIIFNSIGSWFSMSWSSLLVIFGWVLYIILIFFSLYNLWRKK